MKKRLLLLLFSINPTLIMYESDLCPRPNGFRLTYLDSILEKYGSDKSVSCAFRDEHMTEYVFTWKKPMAQKASIKELSFDQAIKIADTFLRSKLPDSIFPNPSRVLSVGKYTLGNTLSSKSMVGRFYTIKGFDGYGHVELHPKRLQTVWIDSDLVTLI